MKRLSAAGAMLLAAFPVLAQETYSLSEALKTAKTELWESARFTIELAETERESAAMRPNPKLNVQTLNVTESAYFADNTRWNDPVNRQVWWQLTKPFLLPAQRRLQLETADKHVDLARKTLEEQERMLFRDAALQWLEVWSLRRKTDAWQVACARFDSLLAIAREDHLAQRVSETAMAELRVAAINGSLKLYKYRRELAEATSRLQTLLGVSGSITVDTADRALLVPENELEALSAVAETRSDLQLKRLELDAAGSELELQRSLAWPQPELGVIYNPQNSVPYAGFYGTIEIPVFSRNQGGIRRSEVALKRVGDELAKAQDQAGAELLAASEAHVSARADFEELQRLLSDSELLFGELEQLAAAGKITAAALFAAQSSRIEVLELYYDQAQLYGESYIRLLFASGTIGKLTK